MGKKARKQPDLPDLPHSRNCKHRDRKPRVKRPNKRTQHSQEEHTQGSTNRVPQHTTTTADSIQKNHQAGTRQGADRGTITKKTVETQTLEAWKSMYGHWEAIATMPLPSNRTSDKILEITRSTLRDALKALKAATTTVKSTPTNKLNMEQTDNINTATSHILDRGCATPLPPPATEEFPMAQEKRQIDMTDELHPRNLGHELNSVTPAHKTRQGDKETDGVPEINFEPQNHPYIPSPLQQMSPIEKSTNNHTHQPHAYMNTPQGPLEASKAV